MVGISSSLTVPGSYENSNGKIIVPTDLSNLSQLQSAGIPQFPQPLIVQDESASSQQKRDVDAKRRKPKLYQCSF